MLDDVMMAQADISDADCAEFEVFGSMDVSADMFFLVVLTGTVLESLQLRLTADLLFVIVSCDSNTKTTTLLESKEYRQQPSGQPPAPGTRLMPR